MNAESTIKTMRCRPTSFTEAGAWREVGGDAAADLTSTKIGPINPFTSVKPCP